MVVLETWPEDGLLAHSELQTSAKIKQPILPQIVTPSTIAASKPADESILSTSDRVHSPLKSLSGPQVPPLASGVASRSPITIRPSGRPGFSAPKAATLFLGKDHERWKKYDPVRLGLSKGWQRIVTSAVSSHGGHPSSRGAFSSCSDVSEPDDSDGGASSVASFRSKSSRNSGRRNRKPSDAYTPPITPTETDSHRPRRFSTNGPEAAFLRYETVIGLHNPRHRSSASSDNLSFLGPLAQIHPHITPSSSSIAPLSTVCDKHLHSKGNPKHITTFKAKIGTKKQESRDASRRKQGKPHPEKLVTPSILHVKSNLEEAAAAAAAASSIFTNRDDNNSLLLNDPALNRVVQCKTNEPSVANESLHSFLIPASPTAPLFKLAKRRKPELVEGTLYDPSGPFREGAVTDGLSVRLFSSEHKSHSGYCDDSNLNHSETPISQPWDQTSSSSDFDDNGSDHVKRRKSAGSDPPSLPGDGGQQRPDGDASYHASTYLITTPDNRVSSAAKFRRWAMDGQGNFYAAMEIKSVEAKLRAADPKLGKVTRELAKVLKEAYLKDILDEVQKAETLNPTRTRAFAKVLMTQDGRYIRLEEDYPEEAFFVIAGCEENELYGVVALVFVQAIRILSRFHAAGWMHGDVKLENLMFDGQGQLVVIDYENANPYRGIPESDGTVPLASYDWIPPEAILGPTGRRMGPSGDLWALGCNLIRAFALRDGVEDTDVRKMLLADGRNHFLHWVSKLIRRREVTNQPGNIHSLPNSFFTYEVDLEPIFADTVPEPTTSSSTVKCIESGSETETSMILLPTPARLLYRFARSSPELLTFVLTRCVVQDEKIRGFEAETEGLLLANWFEKEQKHLIQVGKNAVDTAIQLSGSGWVRPKLDQARKNLGLE